MKKLFLPTFMTFAITTSFSNTISADSRAFKALVNAAADRPYLTSFMINGFLFNLETSMTRSRYNHTNLNGSLMIMAIQWIIVHKLIHSFVKNYKALDGDVSPTTNTTCNEPVE